MNDKSAAAEPHSLPAGEAREHRDLVRDVGETRGEVRTFKWASALAFVAIIGTMGFFYSALETLNEGQKDIRQTLGAIYNQTQVLEKHLVRQDERVLRLEAGFIEVNARLDQVDARLDQVDGRMDEMDGQIHKVEKGLEQVNGRLDRMDGRHEQMDARLGSMEDLLRVLVARSADPS